MMTSPAYQELMKGIKLLPGLLWYVFMLCIFVYGVAAQFLGGSAPLVPAIVPPVLAAVAAAAGLLIQKWGLSDKMIAYALAKTPTPEKLATDAESGKINPQQLEKYKGLTTQELRMVGAATSYFLPFLLSSVLFEAVAIFGLIAAQGVPQADALVAYLPYGAAALVLLLLNRPQIDSFLARAQHAAAMLPRS